MVQLKNHVRQWITIKSFAYTGFFFAGDLLKIDGTFISYENLKQIHPMTNPIEYSSIRTAVRTTLHTQDLHTTLKNHKRIWTSYS